MLWLGRGTNESGRSLHDAERVRLASLLVQDSGRAQWRKARLRGADSCLEAVGCPLKKGPYTDAQAGLSEVRVYNLHLTLRPCQPKGGLLFCDPPRKKSYPKL